MKHKEERKGLESILEQIQSTDLTEYSDLTNEGIQIEPQNNRSIDIDLIREMSKADSVKSLNSIISFVVAEGALETPIIKNRIQIDILSLSNMIFQIKTNQFAIEKILTDINNNVYTPKTFDSLRAMQENQADSIKNLQNYLIGLQRIYTELNSSIISKEFQQESPVKLISNSISIDDEEISEESKKDIERVKSFISRGSKNLLKAIQREDERLEE